MKNCTYCGTANDDRNDICKSCGSPLEQPINITPKAPQREYLPPIYVDTTSQIILSIVVIVLCCLPFGIASLILALNANNQSTQELADKRIATANKLNIAGVIIGIFAAILYAITNL